MAHRREDEAGVTRALAIGIRMTPAELAKGRFMRAPDGHEAPASRSDAVGAVEDFIADQFLGGTDDEEDQDQANQDSTDGNDTPDDDAPDDDDQSDAGDDDQDDAAGEAAKPIDAPVSWDKDAKELFAQLPPDLQAKVVEREAQRDRVVQSATTAAAEAKRNATAEANAMFADQQRQYASHLEQIAAQFAPQRPDPALLAQDPQAFYHLQSLYEQEVAQQQELRQRASHANSEAEQREAITRQHALVQDHNILAEKLGDDWTDPGKRKALLTSLEEVGALLGYSPEAQGQAGATDILALKAAAEWKAKADKYDQSISAQMKRVRNGESLTRAAKPGTSPTRGERSARNRDTAWQNLKASGGKSGDAAAAVLENMGIKL
jgi:hypothetical protein